MTGATGPSHKVLRQWRWLGRRLFQHGSLILRVTAGRAELCLESGIEDPPCDDVGDGVLLPQLRQQALLIP